MVKVNKQNSVMALWLMMQLFCPQVFIRFQRQVKSKSRRMEQRVVAITSVVTANVSK